MDFFHKNRKNKHDLYRSNEEKYWLKIDILAAKKAEWRNW